MGFAFIEYETEKKNKLTEAITSLINPFDVQNLKIFEIEGYKIHINVSRSSAIKTKERVLKKIIKFLAENNVSNITCENFDGIYKADGMALSALMAFKQVDFSKEAVIVCGERNITEIALCAVCPRVKRISMYGCSWDSRKTDEYFFDEYGINIQHIKGNVYKCFEYADIIIDCRRNKNITAENVPLECVYYSLFEKSQKEQNWIYDKGRIDVSEKGEFIKTDRAECVLCTVEDDFHKLLDDDVKIEEKMKIAENMGMSALTSH